MHAPLLPGQRVLAALGTVTVVLSVVALARGRPAPAPAATPTVGASAPVASLPVDLNEASVLELERLPRVGPALAARIVEGRPYRSIDDLDRVPGIGPRTIERLRGLVRVTPPSRAGTPATWNRDAGLLYAWLPPELPLMRSFFFLVSLTALLAGCPTRNTTTDTGPSGVDAPSMMDAPVATCPTAGPEDTVAACGDGCSNDGDAFADCEDRDCCGVVTCGPTTFCGRDGGTSTFDGGPPAAACDGAVGTEDSVAACSDGCSNDGDSFADCQDRDCCGLVTCPAGTFCGDMGTGSCDGGLSPENTTGACGDGCDNDGNGFVDCDDFDCCGVVTCGPTTSCGRFDGGSCAAGPESTIAACGDGCSNDGDTYVDCEDRDCCGVVSCAVGTFCGSLGDAGPRPDGGVRVGSCDGGTRAESSVLACGNGCDDDGDGYTDCDDYGCCGLVTCGASTACGRLDAGGCALGLENTVAACGDACSNDGDRFVDCEDRDCCGVVSCGPTTFCGRTDAGP